MPAFFPQSRQLPLTPPEYYEQYAYPGKQPQAAHHYDQYQQYANSYYMSDPYYPRSELERRARYEEAMVQQMKSNYASVPHRENPYGPVAAPILPPLRSSEQEQQRQVPQHSYKKEEPAQNKQEKSAGGVAAELDYDMEMMVDFVSQMTSGMWAPFVARHDLSDADFVGCIQPGAITVEKKFRKYVQSVLTSTRLPSATLLLALHYLSDRIKRRSARGDFPHRNSNNLYHHLTVALMLASKFLDDNTFQNRSWAEVSQLPVHELNAREMDWLHDIRWQLHVDWEDSTGVRAWFVKWEEYTTLRLAPAGNLGLDQLKLNPIDVNLRNMMPSAPISPPNRDLPSFENLKSQYEHVRLPAPDIQWPQIRSLSPPSAGPTHANTPEYYGSANATPCYLPSQHQSAQLSQEMEYRARNGVNNGLLLYTRQSPIYGPGYVCETRQFGSSTYDTHSFVGLDYTAQYASQLELGWCELHRRYKCLPCGGGTQAMYSQAAVA